MKLSYIIGTVYMDMSLKPNILADLAREHYIAPPPPRRKFCHPSDEIMLEDESGRVRLIGPVVQSGMGKFVTGQSVTPRRPCVMECAVRGADDVLRV